ncbi:MAG: hydrogenase maturation protease [Anaerolineae bacterium]|nr:hydrogenase maturation protease [Anaerolineae bacterium]
MSTLVLGLGNPILTDDGVGIYAVREAARRCPRADVTFAEAGVGGLRLLEQIGGYARVILVDAIQTPTGRPGDVRCLRPGDLHASLHAGSSHDLSLPGALALGRQLGLPLPPDEAIVILAMEVADVLTFGEACTPPVRVALPHLIDLILFHCNLQSTG